MKRRGITERVLTVILSVCMVFTMCPFISDGWNNSGHVEAVEKGTAKGFADYARKLEGKSVKTLNVPKELTRDDTGWCAWFVNYCAKKTGNTSSFSFVNIGRKNYVDEVAVAAVKAGGKITFVNYTAFKSEKSMFKKWSGRCEYKNNYVPKKGDLYIQAGSLAWFGHIGIVRNTKSTNSKYYTVEGNTDCKCSAHHNNYKYVELKTRKKDNANYKCHQPIAFVTLKYSGSGTSSGGSSSGSTNPSAGTATKLAVSVSKISIKEGKAATISGKVTSNYTITKIKGTLQDNNTGESQTKVIDKSDFGKSKKSVKIAGSKIDKNLKCGKLTAGSHTLTIQAWDSSGASRTATATVTVNGAVKTPSIGSEKCVAGGKTVAVSKNSSQTSAKLWYQIGSQTAKSTTSNSVTVPITSTATVKAWCELSGKKSATVTRNVAVSKLRVPMIDGSQNGKKINIVLTSEANSARIMYQIGTSGWKSDYTKGKILSLTNGQQLQYYAKADGYVNSDIGTFTAELTEPDTPQIRLLGSEDKVAVGKSVTVGWNRDWKAESYTAVLHKKTENGEGEEVEKIETDKPTASFTLNEEGEYYIDVIASNELGDSEASNELDVEAKGPLTVVFRDAGADRKPAAVSGDDPGEEYGPEIAKVTIDYGEKITQKMEEPSRRGHTFLGWENTNTGEVSPNAYMQKAVTEDTTFVATYEKKKYSIRFYDPDGEYLMTNETAFGDDAVTDEVIEMLTDKGFINEGKVLKGWTVIRVADDDSEANVHAVDSNMHVQAVCEWENADLPVVITIQGEVRTEQDEDGDVVVRPQVKLTTNEARKKEIYLIATLKGQDEESGTEKALYMDRRVFSIPKGEVGLVLNAGSGSHDFDLPLEAEYTNAVAKLELVALEKKPNGTTGSTYSNVAEANVIRDVGFTEPSEWSTERPEEQEGRVIRSKTQYRYRDKVTAYSGQESLAGYTKEGSESLGTSYSSWSKGTGTNIVRVYDQYKEVVTAENRNAYKSFCKICSCGKWAAETKSGKCSYCGTNTITNRKLKVFSSQKLSGTKESGTGNGGGAFRYGKTVTVNQSYSGIGYVYMITYGHDTIQTLNTFTSKNAKGYLFLWQDDNGATQQVYRLKTEKIRNKFYKYTDWTGWADAAVNATATRQVETRTVYQYQDKIQPPPLETALASDENGVKTFSGNLDVEDDLAGKKGTVMVYQANNTDPNKYQMQYTGQITFTTDPDDEEIGKNHYEFGFIPKDPPSRSTGNFIVSIGVEGTTGLVTVGVIESPKDPHTVTLYYQEKDTEQGGNKQTVIATQTVKDGEDVDLSGVEVPERAGYYFAGWNHRTTNIREDCEIEAVYLPTQNAVAFVDWINQTIDLRTAVTGEEINLPVIDTEEESPYAFRGWKKEDGSLIEGDTVTVEGNMVITADYEPATFTVRFIGLDGSVVDEQQVEYHKSAEPPAYDLSGETSYFAGWSTDVNWWEVEEDVDVRPIIVHDEQAIAPVADIVTDEETGARSVVLETEETGADIYYTTDGTEPTAELIQEYLQTDPELYRGSILKYTGPIMFPEDGTAGEESEEAAIGIIDVCAATYIAGKDISQECAVAFEKEPDPDEVISHEEMSDWKEIGEYNVKAKADKNIQVKVDLEDNPGLTGYDFLVEGDKGVFYPDSDEYGDPDVETGEAFRQGTTLTSDLSDGWRVNWNSAETNAENGNLFTMTLHVKEEAEEGIYPITVSYAPESTLDENYDATELENVKVTVDSEASIPIDTLEATLSRTTYVYEGEAFEPVVRIEGLREGDDFTVEYENNVNVGTAKAVITGKGDYTGTVEKEFTITPVNIANADIAPIGDQVKTGSAIEPEMDITFNGMPLVRGTDYEAAFTDNVEVGTAGVAISGKGNFKGTAEAQFNIIETTESRLEAAEAAVADLQQQLADMESEKESIQQQLTQAQNSYDTLLEEKNGLETQVTNLTAEKTALEQREAELLQQKAELEENAQENQQALAEIQDELDEITAQKGQLETDLQNAQNEKDAIEQQLTQAQTTVNDLTSQKEALETRNNELQTELDEAQAEIARLQKALEESKVDSLDEVKVSGIRNRVYTGSALQQTLTVTVGGKTLVNGTDYTVAYKDNKNVGTATVTISGKNEYRGTFSRTFKINPKGTSISKLIKGKKKMTVKWKKQAAQTTGYQIRYSLKKNFKSGVKAVTVKGPKTTSKVIKKLKAKKTYYVQVRTYKTVSGKKYYSAWSKTKYVKTK